MNLKNRILHKLKNGEPISARIMSILDSSMYSGLMAKLLYGLGAVFMMSLIFTWFRLSIFGGTENVIISPPEVELPALPGFIAGIGFVSMFLFPTLAIGIRVFRALGKFYSNVESGEINLRKIIYSIRKSLLEFFGIELRKG